jgi:hypothetical protein
MVGCIVVVIAGIPIVFTAVAVICGVAEGTDEVELVHPAKTIKITTEKIVIISKEENFKIHFPQFSKNPPGIRPEFPYV